MRDEADCRPVPRGRRVQRIHGRAAGKAGWGLDDGSVQDFRADREGVHTALASMGRAVGEYRGAAYEERVQRRKPFFGGAKEAEKEVGGRGSRVLLSRSSPLRVHVRRVYHAVPQLLSR